MTTLSKTTSRFQPPSRLPGPRYWCCRECGYMHKLDESCRRCAIERRFNDAVVKLRAVDDDDAVELAASALEAVLSDWPVFRSAKPWELRGGTPEPARDEG